MGSSQRETPSNRFAAPVEEQRASPALPSKPLSLWIGQLVVGSQAPLALFAVWRVTRQGSAPPLALFLYSLLALGATAIVLGVQARKHWARVALILTLLFMLVTFSVLALRGDEQTSTLVVGWLLWGGLMFWAGFGKKARAYFHPVTQR